jgi:hypothetical protein
MSIDRRSTTVNRKKPQRALRTPRFEFISASSAISAVEKASEEKPSERTGSLD